MVDTFTFARTPYIYFGLGNFVHITKHIKDFGDKALVITGKASFGQTKYWEWFQEHCEVSKITCIHITISGEPSPLMIDNIIQKLRGKAIKVVVGIGGGSVLDAGKAIAAMFGKTNSVRHYIEGIGHKKHDGTTLPFIAVPTTSGTGSETTKNAVLSESGKHGFKKSLRHDNFVPKVAIIDPQLTCSCPPFQTAISGMDAFSQLLESFLSFEASQLTETLGFKGIVQSSKFLYTAYQNGSNIEARTGLSYAAMVSGITLANAGLGTVHGFASSIGGKFDIPHGVICATMMGEVNRITIRKLRETKINPAALDKYGQVGRLFFRSQRRPNAYYIDGLIEKIQALIELMKIPNLSAYGVTNKDIPQIVANTKNRNNPIQLNQEDLIAVLEARL